MSYASKNHAWADALPGSWVRHEPYTRARGEATGHRGQGPDPAADLRSVSWIPCASDLLHEINHTFLEEKNLNF